MCVCVWITTNPDWLGILHVHHAGLKCTAIHLSLPPEHGVVYLNSSAKLPSPYFLHSLWGPPNTSFGQWGLWSSRGWVKSLDCQLCVLKSGRQAQHGERLVGVTLSARLLYLLPEMSSSPSL